MFNIEESENLTAGIHIIFRGVIFEHDKDIGQKGLLCKGFHIVKPGGKTMPYTPIHPGDVLAEKLGKLGMSPTELARSVHVPANRISQIIAGKRSITADTALRLGRWFGTSPHLWLKLQQAYEINMARKKINAILEKITPYNK